MVGMHYGAFLLPMFVNILTQFGNPGQRIKVINEL
jgi:hypothetical protein